MGSDYNKVCWNCGSKDLAPMGTYVKCRICGATYNAVPSLGADALTPHATSIYDASGTLVAHYRRPSDSVKLAARRAREKK